VAAQALPITGGRFFRESEMNVLRQARRGMRCALLAALAACGDGTDPTFDPVIGNAVDNFTFQIAGMSDVSETRQYTWQNTGTTAVVTRTTSVSAGTGTLTILDAAGTEVYSSPLTTESSGSTQSGVPGAWTIRVELTEAGGGFNFLVTRGN
jgi:hypothetical protein